MQHGITTETSTVKETLDVCGGVNNRTKYYEVGKRITVSVPQVVNKVIVQSRRMNEE